MISCVIALLRDLSVESFEASRVCSCKYGRVAKCDVP